MTVNSHCFDVKAQRKHDWSSSKQIRGNLVYQETTVIYEASASRWQDGPSWISAHEAWKRPSPANTRPKRGDLSQLLPALPSNRTAELVMNIEAIFEDDQALFPPFLTVTRPIENSLI